MDTEQTHNLIQKVSSNDWRIQKENLYNAIKLSNSLLVDKELNKDFSDSERQQLSNLLMQKIIMHSASIFNLIGGIEIPIKQTVGIPKIIDTFSMKVLFRGLLEGYLTLNHINFPVQNNENEIKFKIWLQFGLVQRGKMNIVFYSKEATNQLVIEREQINELINEIKASELFGFLDHEKQDTLLNQIKKDWKIGFKNNTYIIYSWQDLLEKSGVNKFVFKDTYNFLSWFAHSTSVSLFQLRDYYEIEHANHETLLIMMETSIFVVLALTDLIKVDNELLYHYSLLPQYDKDLINIYNFVYRSNKYTIDKIFE
jgi:hypothetical protein